MFQFTELALFRVIYLQYTGLSHSEIFGYNARVQLPEAYRSLPRPSSPSGAKASIVCPYTLTEILALNARRSSALTDKTTMIRKVAPILKYSIVKDQNKHRLAFAH